MKKLVFVLAFVLVAAGTAQGGNWAAVELASAPPAKVSAGDTWTATFSVLRHGLASQPVAGVRPSVTIRNGTVSRTFRANPTARTGVYRARVVFPSSGTWSYAVYDGFTWYGHAQTHSLGTVSVEAAAEAAGFPTWPVAGGALGAAALAALVLATRRLRPRPQPAIQG